MSSHCSPTRPVRRAPRILHKADEVELLRLEQRRVERNGHRVRTVVDEIVDAVVSNLGAAEELEVVHVVALLNDSDFGLKKEPVVDALLVARSSMPLRAMPVLPRASTEPEVKVPDSATPTERPKVGERLRRSTATSNTSPATQRTSFPCACSIW